MTTRRSQAADLARRLRERFGFDQTKVGRSDNGTPYARVKCSQCEALVINGTACHEPGCLNARTPVDDTNDDDDD